MLNEGRNCHLVLYPSQEVLERKTVTDTRLSSSLGSLKHLPISNALYENYALDGTTIILEHNTNISTGDIIKDYLQNTLHSG